MKKFLLSLALMPVLVWAGINDQCAHFTVNGVPQYQALPDDQELCKTNYAVIHRCAYKTPLAVFEHLTPAAMSGPAKRRDNFRADPDVLPQCQSTLMDYAAGSHVYDRGHMSPAGNNTQTGEIMSESFFLSNMVPQVANNNRGIWKQLEIQERQLAKEPGTAYYIISGTVYGPNYKVIGNGVGVPDYLYKIIVEKNTGKVRAYLIPNTALPVADLDKYQTTVATIEQHTGLKFNLQ